MRHSYNYSPNTANSESNNEMPNSLPSFTGQPESIALTYNPYIDSTRIEQSELNYKRTNASQLGYWPQNAMQKIAQRAIWWLNYGDIYGSDNLTIERLSILRNSVTPPAKEWGNKSNNIDIKYAYLGVIYGLVQHNATVYTNEEIQLVGERFRDTSAICKELDDVVWILSQEALQQRNLGGEFILESNLLDPRKTDFYHNQHAMRERNLKRLLCRKFVKFGFDAQRINSWNSNVVHGGGKWVRAIRQDYAGQGSYDNFTLEDWVGECLITTIAPPT